MRTPTTTIPPAVLAALDAAGADEEATCTTAAAVDNMTTSSIVRWTGARADGSSWSVIAKHLQPASADPRFALIPVAFRPEVLEQLDWTDEPRIYRSGLADRLPKRLRMPRVLSVEEHPDRITLWLEDVEDRSAWDACRYRAAARALGALAGRWSGTSATTAFGIGGRDIGAMFHGKVLHADLPAQADDAFWSRPEIADAVDADHRRDLTRLAEAMPRLLAAEPRLAQGLCHGDASPSNLLDPGDGSLVAIDWSYCHVGSVGSDGAQLVADAPDPEAVLRLVLDGCAEGLDEERAGVPRIELEQAVATHLAVRWVFSALLPATPDGHSDPELVRRRAAGARFGLDLALRHATR